MKDLPEPDDYAEEEQDWGLLFGRLRQGKDQEEVEHHLLGLLKVLHKRLKGLKKQLKDIEKIKDPEKKRKALLDLQIYLAKYEEEASNLIKILAKFTLSPGTKRISFGFLNALRYTELPNLSADLFVAQESHGALVALNEKIAHLRETENTNAEFPNAILSYNVAKSAASLKKDILSWCQGNTKFSMDLLAADDSVLSSSLKVCSDCCNVENIRTPLHLYDTVCLCHISMCTLIDLPTSLTSTNQLKSSTSQIDRGICPSTTVFDSNLVEEGNQLIGRCENAIQEQKTTQNISTETFNSIRDCRQTLKEMKPKIVKEKLPMASDLNITLPKSIAQLAEVEYLLLNAQELQTQDFASFGHSFDRVELNHDLVQLHQVLQTRVRKQAIAISIFNEYENIVMCLNAWLEQSEEELETLNRNPDEQKLELISCERETFQSTMDRATGLFHTLISCIKLRDEMEQRKFHASLEKTWEKMAIEISNKCKKQKQKKSLAVDLERLWGQTKSELEEIATIVSPSLEVASDEQLIIEKRKYMFLNKKLASISCNLERCLKNSEMRSEHAEGMGQIRFDLGQHQTLVNERIVEIDHLIDDMREMNNEMKTSQSIIEIISRKLDTYNGFIQSGTTINQVEKSLLGLQNQLAYNDDLLDKLGAKVEHIYEQYHTLHLNIEPLVKKKLVEVSQEQRAVANAVDVAIAQNIQLRSLSTTYQKDIGDLQTKLQTIQRHLAETIQTGDLTLESLIKSHRNIESLRDEFHLLEDDLNRVKDISAQLQSLVEQNDAVEVDGQVQSVTVAFNELSKNLNEEEIKFSTAIQLWHNYREELDNIQLWSRSVEHEVYFANLKMNLPNADESGVEDVAQRIKILQNELLEKEDRLQQLKRITTDICLNASMDDVGQALLQTHVENLSHKLTVLRDALNIVNARAEVRTKAQKRCHDTIVISKKSLKTMREKLKPYEAETDPDSSSSEEQLSQLRSQLLALGRAESELTALNEPIVTAHEITPLPVPSDSQPELLPKSQQSNLTAILQDWQNVFQDTFAHYHRLSTNLAAHEDISGTIAIWQRYLKFVQSFLQDQIAHNMITLTEQQRLGDVHHRILAGHHHLVQSQLEHCQQEGDQSKARKAIVTQLDNLSRAHEEVMDKITQRNANISERLLKWNNYRKSQENLFEWLERIEHQKLQLNLKHVQVELVPTLLGDIEDLLDQVPKGESLTKDLEAQLKILLQTAAIKGKKTAPIDEILQKSLQLELHALKERISSIKASLKTWVDHLQGIQKLDQNYTQSFEELEGDLDKLRETLKRLDGAPKDSETDKELKKHQADIQAAQKELETVLPRLSKIADLQDELRECTSPSDIKKASHQLWLLRHKRSELDFHFKIKDRQVQERLDLVPNFEERVDNFNVWADDLKRRLQELDEEMATQGRHYLTNYIPQFDADLDSELEAQKMQVDWIDSAGQRLAKRPKSSEFETKTKQTHDRWLELKRLRQSRASKAEAAKADAKKIIQQMAAFKAWVKEIEARLNRPVNLANTSENEYQMRHKDYQDIQKQITNKSPKASEIFNNCEVFLTEPLNAATYEPIKTSYFNLQRRWDQICSKCSDRQQELEQLRSDWTRFLEDHERLQTKIDVQVQELKALEVQASGQSYKDVGALEQRLLVLKDNHQTFVGELEHLNDFYCELARDYRLDTSDELKSKFIKRTGLSQLRQELKVKTSQLDKVQETSLNLIQKSELKDAEHIEEVTQEFTDLRNDLATRLTRLSDELHVIDVPTLTTSEDDLSRGSSSAVVHESIQVETLRFERDAGVQADTLLTQSAMSGPDSGVSAMSTSWPVSPSGDRGATPLSDFSPADTPGLVERFVSEYQEQQLTQTEAIKEMAKESTHDALVLDIDRYINKCDEHLSELQVALLEEEVKVDRGEASAQTGVAAVTAPSVSALIAPALMIAPAEGISSQDLGLLLASCRSTFDLVTHLNSQLITEHQDQSRVQQVKKLRERLSQLETSVRHLRTKDSQDNSLMRLKIATITPAPFQSRKSSIPRFSSTRTETISSTFTTTSSTSSFAKVSQYQRVVPGHSKPPLPTNPSRLPRRSMPDRGGTGFETGTRSKPVSRSTTPTRRRASTPTRSQFSFEKHIQHSCSVQGGYLRPTFSSRKKSVGATPGMKCECQHCSASTEYKGDAPKSFRGSMPTIAWGSDLSQVVSPVRQYIHENKPIMTGRERFRSEEPEERRRKVSEGFLDVGLPTRDSTLNETERVDFDAGAALAPNPDPKCPMCKRQSWKQLNKEMWRMEKWSELARATLKSNRSVPKSMEQLEDAIQDHREFLMELDSHKSLMMSINVIGSHLAEHSRDKPKVQNLQKRLVEVNAAWDNTCEEAMLWRTKLQTALLENSEFHRTIDELSHWLEATTASIRSSEPVDLTVDPSVLEAKYEKFIQLHEELQRYEPRIVSLQEAAENSDCDDVKRKLSQLAQRLRILINVCHVYASRIARALGRDTTEAMSGLPETDLILPTLSDELMHLPDANVTLEASGLLATDDTDSQPDGANSGVLSRSYRFLGRVVRAAVPIQAMMLLLLGVSSIVPLDQDELICTLQNNLERSFEPMMRWSNGPPPI
eukprot:maker-scaffold207_size258870-snap-gene-0.13 protein:Tk01444 transcript:maker-scaffold207_size258870-snap-gene-0.13-mRNA-1 annotation:"nesprin"